MACDDFLAIIERYDTYKLVPEPDIKAPTTKTRNIDEFTAINAFYEKHGREPNFEDDMSEIKLAGALERFRQSAKARNELKAYDQHNLLVANPKISTLDDVLNSSVMKMLDPLDNSAYDIFDLKNVTKPEIVQERKRIAKLGETTDCQDFELFEPLFAMVHQLLSSGKKSLVSVRQTGLRNNVIEVGSFYILKGMLIYLEDVGKTFQSDQRKDAREEQRARVIFSNGTESNMLLNSLSVRLYEDELAQRVINIDGTVYNARRAIAGGGIGSPLCIYDKKQITGYVYIGRTCHPEYRDKEHLHKIGLTTRCVTSRFAEAHRDPAFLLSEAEQVKVIPLEGLEIKSVERALHDLFQQVRLDIDVVDELGIRHSAREWFEVPLSAIDEAVTLISEDKIHAYCYDRQQQQIVER